MVPSGPPIAEQPTWVQIPTQTQIATNCPAGFEYLTLIDQVVIHQQIDMMEGMFVSRFIELLSLFVFTFLLLLSILKVYFVALALNINNYTLLIVGDNKSLILIGLDVIGSDGLTPLIIIIK